MTVLVASFQYDATIQGAALPNDPTLRFRLGTNKSYLDQYGLFNIGQVGIDVGPGRRRRPGQC